MSTFEVCLLKVQPSLKFYSIASLGKFPTSSQTKAPPRVVFAPKVPENDAWLIQNWRQQLTQ